MKRLLFLSFICGLLLSTTFAEELDLEYYPPFDIHISSPEPNENISTNIFLFEVLTNHEHVGMWVEGGVPGYLESNVMFMWNFENDTISSGVVQDASWSNNDGYCVTPDCLTYGDYDSPTGTSAIITSDIARFNCTTDFQTQSHSFWVKPTDISRNADTTFGRWDGISNEGWYFNADYKNEIDFHIFELDGTEQEITIPFTGNPANLEWMYLTVDVIDGTDVFIFRNGVVFGHFEIDGYAETTADFEMYDNPSVLGSLYIDDLFCSLEIIKQDDIYVLMGEEQNFARHFSTLLPNSTYILRACGKATEVGQVYCDNLTFYTDAFLTPSGEIPDTPFAYNFSLNLGNLTVNLAPVIYLYGTDTGWVTSNSTPYIRYVISDDSQIDYDCNLLINGVVDTSFHTNNIYGTIGINQTLSDDEYLVSMTCEDSSNSTGSSEIYVLSYTAEFNYVPVKVCIYDNETLQALGGTIHVTDEFSRTLFYETFEECFEREIVRGFGDYYYLNIFSPSHIIHSEKVQPPLGVNKDIYLVSFETVAELPAEINLTCSNLRVNEYFELDFDQELCDFSVWRCNTNKFPTDCEIIGSEELYGASNAYLKVSSSQYYGDYLFVQSSCEPSFKCFSITEEFMEAPGILVNLAQDPTQGYFFVIILIIGGILMVAVGK